MGKHTRHKLRTETYDDETKAILTRSIFKLVYNEAIKNFVKEKLEENGFDLISKSGRPKVRISKINVSEENKIKERLSSQKFYYKHKAIKVQ